MRLRQARESAQTRIDGQTDVVGKDGGALEKGHHHLRLPASGWPRTLTMVAMPRSDFDARTYRSITPEENILNACQRSIP
jgi:hypothetical protein